MRGLEGSPFAASVVAFVFAGCLSGGAANAADLGGDCCSDLEERVAELEATTVRKGNKKVTVTLYGRVNRIVNFWDDGVESNTYTLNSSYSPTRWGFRGDAKIGGAWTAGYNLEMEDNGNLSKFVDQFNDNPANGAVIVRRSAMYLDNKTLGQVTWCLWSEAKDDITKDNVVIKGLDQTMHADFYMNWSFFLRPKGSQFENAQASQAFAIWISLGATALLTRVSFVQGCGKGPPACGMPIHLHTSQS